MGIVRSSATWRLQRSGSEVSSSVVPRKPMNSRQEKKGRCLNTNEIREGEFPHNAVSTRSRRAKPTAQTTLESSIIHQRWNITIILSSVDGLRGYISDSGPDSRLSGLSWDKLESAVRSDTLRESSWAWSTQHVFVVRRHVKTCY